MTINNLDIEIDVHAHQRRQLWCDVFIAAVRANPCNEYRAVGIADEALKLYDERFPAPTRAPNTP